MKKPAPMTEDEREEFEERAAILEYDGEMPRWVAEREALRLIQAKRKARR